MTPALRPYQSTAVAAVREAWRSVRAVLLVAPTGSGKTVMFAHVIRDTRALVIVHRRELVTQAARAVPGSGIIAPGYPSTASPVQVATVQTLLARGTRPPADVIVLDEAHHYAADDWRQLAAAYPAARVLGVTATPQRADGRPLGDVFERLIVAAQYPDLLRDGHLTACRVFQPREVAASGLECHPVDAYERHAEASQAFVFCGTVAFAKQLADEFTARGTRAVCITAKTPKAERDYMLGRFAAGAVRVVTNVGTMTEGVDIPAARTVILASSIGHVGGYLQRVGRVLRPHPSKPDAIVIDLSGATLQHGMPTEARHYSLDGTAIARTSPTPLRVCRECGATVEAWIVKCPLCGYVHVPPPVAGPRIYDRELRMVFAGVDTAADAKQREYARLRAVATSRGWSVGWVVREYRKLFNEAPRLDDVTPDEKRAELARLRELAAAKGYKPGFAAVRYKEAFGVWPRR